MVIREYYEILLSIQVALTTHISPFLRAITFELDDANDLFNIVFFYDGEVTDELFDLASCATVEMDMGRYEIVNDITARVDYPEKIPIRGRLIYLRKEPIPTLYSQPSIILSVKEVATPRGTLLLATQDALLGRVSSALRKVNVALDVDSKRLEFYFVYNGELLEEYNELAKAIAEEVVRWFPGFSVRREVLRVDFPQKAPSLGDRCLYSKHEGYGPAEWPG